MNNNEQSRLDQLEALAASILEGLKETRAIANSNARAIEATTANVAELARDRATMYQLMADLSLAEAEGKREMYRLMAATDSRQSELSRRQGEIVELMKLLVQKVNE